METCGSKRMSKEDEAVIAKRTVRQCCTEPWVKPLLLSLVSHQRERLDERATWAFFFFQRWPVVTARFVAGK